MTGDDRGTGADAPLGSRTSDPPDLFGPEVAARYDGEEAAMFGTEALDREVGFLHELAGGGPALELAIGTGRVGLPLAARGTPVSGIELSASMVAQLRAKPGGRDIPVEIGDMSSTRVEGSFSLVYLVFNSLVNLTSQDAQLACFRNAAAHLDPGGHFVVELRVPPLRRLLPGERTIVADAGPDHWCVDEVDPVTQSLVSHHFTREGDGFRQRSIPFRYAWPAELDLMARLAGLHLRERWADWSRAPFTAESPRHVSVWAAD